MRFFGRLTTVALAASLMAAPVAVQAQGMAGSTGAQGAAGSNDAGAAGDTSGNGGLFGQSWATVVSVGLLAAYAAVVLATTGDDDNGGSDTPNSP